MGQTTPCSGLDNGESISCPKLTFDSLEARNERYQLYLGKFKSKADLLRDFEIQFPQSYKQWDIHLLNIWMFEASKSLLAPALKYLTTRQKVKMNRFMLDVKEANLELLDIAINHYNTHSKANQINQFLSLREFSLFPVPSSKISCLESQMSEAWNSRLPNLVTIKDYQEIKTIGFNRIKEGKIGFVILAGGKGFRHLTNMPPFSSQPQRNSGNQSKQGQNRFPQSNFSALKLTGDSSLQKDLVKLPMPSKSCLLQIHLKRLHALSRLVSRRLCVWILCTKEKEEAIKKMAYKFSKYVQVRYVRQSVMAGLSKDSSVLIDKEDHIPKFPRGSADLWFSKTFFEQVTAEKITHLYVKGSHNILDHSVDCFMIGQTFRRDTQWIAKTVPSAPLVREPRLCVTRDGVPRFIDSNEKEQVPENSLTFTGTFIIECQYAKEAIKNVKQEYYKMKNYIYRDKEGKVASFESFERDCWGILESASKWHVIQCNRQDIFCPLIYKNMGAYDQTHCVRTLSYRCCRWLGLKPTQGQVQIDPRVSCEGEMLEDVRQELASIENIQYPLHVQYYEDQP